MKQLKDYNDSLKEQLRTMGDEIACEKEEEGEGASESLERFKSCVYTPSAQGPSLQEKCCIASVHKSNVLSVIPWEKNDHVLFSTDVTKTLYCIEWDEEMEASVVSKVSLSAPCCSLSLLHKGSVLVAGCMDGVAYTFKVESANYRVTGLTVRIGCWRHP